MRTFQTFQLKRVGLLAAALTALSGCSDGGRNASAPAGRLESSASEGGTTITVSPEPTVTVGGASETREDYQLIRVIGATRLSDGGIVILDGGTSELRYFDADGVHERTVGGRGEGPGEFGRVHALRRLAGDSVLVASDRRMTWFTPEGDFARSRDVPFGGPPWRGVPIDGMFSGDFALLPDGSFLRLYLILPVPEAEERVRWPGLLTHAALDPPTFDTLAVLPTEERLGGDFASFGHDLVLAEGEDRFYVGDTDADSILVYDRAGRRLPAVATPFEAAPLPPEATLRERRGPRPTMERTMAEGASYEYPDRYPRYARMLVDRDGLLWVMSYPRHTDPELTVGSFTRPSIPAFHSPSGPAQWRVVDGTGAVAAEVTTPAGVYPLEIGSDYVVGLEQDELDVQTVVLHRLERR